ncbi:hypothetical protein HDV00_007515 [Rhizophlyctis rosea]|nr:hypothetical protein HDV00_007515 [Rhizophlyctis rosea]
MPLAILWAIYGSRMPAAYIGTFKRGLAAAAQAVVNRNIVVSYTNIYLLATASLLITGCRLDSQFLSAGTSHLTNWLTFTAAHGIPEYATPTYLAVDFGALLAAYHFGPPDVTPLILNALDMLWNHTALNYFPGRGGTISGPHSRDYGFLDGIAADYFFTREEYFVPLAQQVDYGLRADQTSAFLIKFNDDHPALRYDPPQGSVELALEAIKYGTSATAIEGRAVMSRAWLDDSVYSIGYRYTYNYITGTYALGSASSPQSGAQSLDVRLELAGCRTASSIVVDRLDSPYGDTLVADVLGKLKATTQRPGVVTVQDRGTVIGLWNVTASADESQAVSLGTNLLVPLDVDELWVDAVKIDPAAPVTVSSNIGGKVMIRKGGVCTAVKVLHATGCDWVSSTGVQVMYLPDQGGTNQTSSRFVIYHTKKLTTTVSTYIPAPQCNGRAMQAFVVRRCDAVGGVAGLGKIMDGASIAKNVFNTTVKQWEVDVTVGGMRAEIGWGLSLLGGRVLWNRVNGVNYNQRVMDQTIWVGRYDENGTLIS